jgi:hypothetical protein
MEFKSKNAISGKEGTAYIKVDGKNEELFGARGIETKIEFSKGAVKCIGRRMEGSKITGMKGTGTLKIWYGSPLFVQSVREYKDTGKPMYFDLVVTNDDPTSDCGRQTMLYKDCLIDGMILSQLDAESEDALSDEIGFTFEDYEPLESFKSI